MIGQFSKPLPIVIDKLLITVIPDFDHATANNGINVAFCGMLV